MALTFHRAWEEELATIQAGKEKNNNSKVDELCKTMRRLPGPDQDLWGPQTQGESAEFINL